jgi:FtsH-binding integral membrane protein
VTEATLHRLLVLLGVIAVAAIAAGVTLAVSGYSSGGAFAVAAACVGVLSTLATTSRPEANA